MIFVIVICLNMKELNCIVEIFARKMQTTIARIKQMNTFALRKFVQRTPGWRNW
jgi:hypothetical protein